MCARFFFVPIICLLIGASRLSWAQGDADDTCKLVEAITWSRSNSLVVVDNLELLYDSHFSALLAAEKKFAAGVAPKDIVEELRSLPGIKGVVFSSRAAGGFQSPEGMVPLSTFSDSVFSQGEATFRARSPMMQRRAYGQIRFIPLTVGNESLDLMVRYVRPDTARPPLNAICLVLDRMWLLAQVPSRMDSLAHESRQLLFWAASPTNRFMEQSLGIICNDDTLWWSGRKDVKVTLIQPAWPFVDVEIHSYVHPLGAK